MKKILNIFLLLTIIFTFNNCEDLEEDVMQVDFVSFESDEFEFGVDIDGSSSNEIMVYTSKFSSSDRTFNIKVNEESTVDSNAYTFSQIMVPANTNSGSFSVTIQDLNISDLGETLVLDIENQDGLYTGESITLKIKRICPIDPVLLNFVFDSWPEEVSWEVKNSSDEILYQVPSGTYAGQSSFTQELCLQNGEYSITFADAYGDGICCGGSYSLTLNGTELASGGDYGLGETISITVQN